ncbi:MAG: hypothetical protein MJZ53_02640 [Paludibacteraceae bacterium]|nr:hypothetical protein [Paludibacteraceae bacterium]
MISKNSPSSILHTPYSFSAAVYTPSAQRSILLQRSGLYSILIGLPLSIFATLLPNANRIFPDSHPTVTRQSPDGRPKVARQS